MKFNQLLILMVCVFLLSACSDRNDPKQHLGEIYSIGLDSIMEKDEALSSDINYIAIDLSNFEDLTVKDKEFILNFFQKKYKVEVINASLKELEEKGAFDKDGMYLEDGVLLRIEKIEYKLFNQVLFEGSKYRSAKGAIGVESTIHYKNGKWKVKDSRETWIS